MTNIEKIIQGLVLLALGFSILKLRDKFILEIKKSHKSFWNNRLKFQKQLGAREVQFGRIVIITLGICFLFGGAALILMGF
jgi:hypothetical protein